MNNLIDKAVFDLNGIWPDGTGEENHLYRFYGGRLVTGVYSTAPSTPEYVCNKDEFTQRAKDLGFINGFEWGKEYPTNGNRPDLPDDVLVEVNFYHASKNWHKDISRNWRWSIGDIVKFRIVDERYKPKADEPEMSILINGSQGGEAHTTQLDDTDVVDIDSPWHELGECPPVGAKCEFIDSMGVWHKVEITAHARLGLCFIECGRSGENYTSKDARNFRPIKTERQRLIEVISSAGYISAGELANIILAEGFRVRDDNNGTL